LQRKSGWTNWRHNPIKDQTKVSPKRRGNLGRRPSSATQYLYVWVLGRQETAQFSKNRTKRTKEAMTATPEIMVHRQDTREK
jgi:hypothetical protein